MKTKIVVPILFSDLTALEKIDEKAYQTADMIEWRADYLTENQILEMAPKFFEKFRQHKILFTIRTSKEGGNIELSQKKYSEILAQIAEKFKPDFIDVEYFSHGRALSNLTKFKDKIVLSYHNFQEMPTDLTGRLIDMEKEKTAFVKAAVMPHRECDVLDLLQITRDLTVEYGEKFITIAMGDLGKLSRLSGYLTGNQWTFASLENASAPGQLSLGEAKTILEILEN